MVSIPISVVMVILVTTVLIIMVIVTAMTSMAPIIIPTSVISSSVVEVIHITSSLDVFVSMVIVLHGFFFGIVHSLKWLVFLLIKNSPLDSNIHTCSGNLKYLIWLPLI